MQPAAGRMEGPLPTPVGLLRNGLGLAPNSVRTLLMDIHRQETAQEPLQMLSSCRWRAGLSFIFSIMPISLTLWKENFKS